ncbi:MAG: hypothetical protein U1E77_11615 [Inhella sp.]
MQRLQGHPRLGPHGGAAAPAGELQAGFADPVLVREGPTSAPSLRRPSARATAAPKPAGALDAISPYRLHHSTQQRGLAIRVTGLRGSAQPKLSSTTPRLAAWPRWTPCSSARCRRARSRRWRACPR